MKRPRQVRRGIRRGRQGGPAHIYIQTGVRRRRLRRLVLALMLCAVIGAAVWIAVAQT